MPSDDVVEFGGWPRPPRWVWAVAGIAVLAVLAGLVVAHTGSHHAAVSSPSRSPAAAAAHHTPARPQWPSAAGACGSAVDLPQIHLARQRADVGTRLLIGGAGLREVTPGGTVSGPLPGLPEHDGVVTDVVAGPRAAYVLDTPCTSSTASVRFFRLKARVVQPLCCDAVAMYCSTYLSLDIRLSLRSALSTSSYA